MSDTEPLIGLFVDAFTGETITRELTADEISALLIAPVVEETLVAVEPVEGERPQIDDIESDVDDVVES